MSTTFEERYASLNKEQKEAVDTLDGPVLVVAGPGTGKTELLSLRVGNILRKTDATPANILCLTFTENGALNMRNRLEKLIGQDAYRVGIFTFHSFCNYIIGKYPEYFYNAVSFSQASDIKKAELIETLFKELPYKHPLASFHKEKGYAYLRDFVERVRHIKSGGYTPSEFKSLVEALEKDGDAINDSLLLWPEGRLSIKRLSEFTSLVEKLEHIQNTTSTLLAHSLGQALHKAEAIGKTAPLGDWKKKYTVTLEEKVILKDSASKDMIEALVALYENYEEKMHTAGLYDYDDMLIEVGHVLNQKGALRNELEEQYQYILIDEFQDTNEAQMNIVKAITSHKVHEGRPNVMVVGDDDQGIYKFQGAEVSHIMHFRDVTYRDVKTIVLTNNYRSTKEILDVARDVITQAQTRLETKYKDISKVLTAANATIPKGEITITSYNADVEEYTHVARAIARAIEYGQSPESIAIISRNHRELKTILSYLDAEAIPYEYSKRSNIFDEDHIKQLITVCTYFDSVLAHNAMAEYLLPEMLSYPFFAIKENTVFAVALYAKKQNTTWMEAIKILGEETNDERLKKFFTVLSELSVRGATDPLPHILEEFIEKSSFKEYYFGKERLTNTPSEYLYFLASLKTFLEALREYKEEDTLFVKDVPLFVAMYRKNNLELTNTSFFTKSAHAVSLLTAHASKGLEFDQVYMIATHDRLWTKSPMVNKIPFPTALTPLLTPAGDTEDDFIRLLYVAMTRAKHTLMISGHEPLVRYLQVLENDSKDPNEEISSEEKVDETIQMYENALSHTKTNFTKDIQVALKKILENYTMSVTHLNNFLNVAEGGPVLFQEQNLFAFPQPMNPAGVYGDAMHKAIEEMIQYPVYHGGEKASQDHLISIFEKNISRGRLMRSDDTFMRNRGITILSSYVKQKEDSYLPEDKVEVSMRDEGVIIGEAKLSGALDFLRLYEDEGVKKWEVRDFKTGKAFSSWELSGLPDYDKIKLHKYRKQLIVYTILLENANSYKNYPVGNLSLEFVEGDENGKIITLSLVPSQEEIEHTKKLIDAVYKKIIALDFPDISSYEKSYKGMLQFEDDLVLGKI